MLSRIIFNAPDPSEYDKIFSNFIDSPILMDGIRYPTVEHAYQAHKCSTIEERKQIAALPNAGKAKRAGRKVKVREDWEQVKYAIMCECLLHKFRIKEFKIELLRTNNKPIIEDASVWDDKIWGTGRDGTGQNLLGKALMKVRTIIRSV